MVDLILRFARWFRSHVVQIVHEDLAVCEFACSETTCSSTKWSGCRRRMTRSRLVRVH
jgi:hypothetical protein